MIDYTLGFELVMYVITTLVVLMFVLSFGVVKLVAGKEDLRKVILVGILALFVIPICVYLVFFPALFSLINLLSQDVLEVSFWKSELSNGVFAIRVTSCILTLKFLSTFIELVKKNNLFEKQLEKDLVQKRDAINDIENLSGEQANLLLTKDLSFLSTLQFAFYLSCASALWFSTINGESNLVVMLTSWCLFYIVDDWTVISEYSLEYKVMPMANHKLKINIFNCLLFVGSSFSLLISENLAQSIFMFITLIFLSSGLAMYYWRASKVVEKLT